MRRFISLFITALLTACATGPHRLAADSTTACLLDEPSGDDRSGYVWEGADRRCPKSWAVRYRHDAASGTPRRHGDHGINYVEIDEQGVLRSRQAAEHALQYAGERAPDGRPVYLVVFIHGWHHDADADDRNVQAFHDALSSISLWHPEHDVRGVYIGWRGRAWTLPPFNYLTFWDRKSTSEEVGRGGLLEFLLRLERVVKDGPAGESNRLVLVGHSFGASVAFNALAHVFLERLLDGVRESAHGAPQFRGYGDLVVLVNPAIEAMRYMPFQSALEYYSDRRRDKPADFSATQVPRLVVLSSEGDWATRYAFPAARFPSTVAELHEHISPMQSPDAGGHYAEWNMDGQTLGNFALFHTHGSLKFASNAAAGGDDPAREERQGLRKCGALPAAAIRERLAATGSDQAVERRFPDSNLELVPKPGAQFTPYLLAAADARVIKDHSDIGQPNLVCWINQLADPRE